MSDRGYQHDGNELGFGFEDDEARRERESIEQAMWDNFNRRAVPVVGPGPATYGDHLAVPWLSQEGPDQYAESTYSALPEPSQTSSNMIRPSPNIIPPVVPPNQFSGFGQDFPTMNVQGASEPAASLFQAHGLQANTLAMGQHWSPYQTNVRSQFPSSEYGNAALGFQGIPQPDARPTITTPSHLHSTNPYPQAFAANRSAPNVQNSNVTQQLSSQMGGQNIPVFQEGVDLPLHRPASSQQNQQAAIMPYSGMVGHELPGELFGHIPNLQFPYLPQPSPTRTSPRPLAPAPPVYQPLVAGEVKWIYGHHDRPPTNVQWPMDIDISIIEICTFCPDWFLNPEAIARAVRNG
ncbi:hypothetical protein Q7P37_011333 [Cladosporium fusiforme]